MTLIAKGQIALRNINDAYNISVSPSSCVVFQDAKGNVNDIKPLSFSISIAQAGQPVGFSIESLSTSSGVNAIIDTTSSSILTEHVCHVSLVKNGTSFGSVVAKLVVGGKYVGNAVFSFTVAVPQVNFPWIEDWNGRQTEIGGEYVITPKMFVGTKHDDGSLSGVYVGQFDGVYGIRGYKDSAVVFEISDRKSFIGGWEIGNSALSNAHISLNAFENSVNVGATSIGTFGVKEVRKFGGVSMFWETNESFGLIGVTRQGAVAFSLGGVNNIAGWNFNDVSIWTGPTNAPGELQSDGLILSVEGLFGRGWFIKKNGSGTLGAGSLTFNQDGGTFASWNFDKEAIYNGIKTNSGFCLNNGDITISREGVRSNGWRLEKDGSGALASGNISWGKDGELLLKDDLKIRGLIVPEATIVNDDNFLQYCIPYDGGPEYAYPDGMMLDIAKTGQLVIFYGANGSYTWEDGHLVNYNASVYGLRLPNYTMLHMGEFNNGVSGDEVNDNSWKREALLRARMFIGTKLIFYNRSKGPIVIYGIAYNKESLASHNETNLTLGAGEVLYAECIVVKDELYNWPNGGTYNGGNEKIGWVGNTARACDINDPELNK